uniref:Gustatory receptor n=1 Tax=Bactrocera dorsalis TaxID=27457 RepID=A0A6M9TZD6_BACDO|nr:gustatory receptor [Bactrocera dorsalis]
MRSLNRVGHESCVKSDKTRKPAKNSILLYLKCHLLLLKYLGLLPFYTTLSAYEIGMPTQRSMYINRAILLAKFALNISHINAVLSPIILQLLFTRSKTDGITNLLDVVFCMLSDITITWTCARSTTEILLIINSFLRVDKLLKQHPDSPAERSCATNHFNRYLFLVFGYISLVMIAYVKHTLDYFSIYFCAYITFYQLENAISCGFVVFISALLHLLTERFQYVNQLIEQYTSKNLVQKRYPYTSTTSILSFKRNTNMHDDTIMRMFAQNSATIYSLHIDLLDIYKMINKYAGLGLLMFLLYACYGLLSCAYGCYVCEWQRSDDLYYGIWTFSWIPLYAGIIILLATNCAKATNQANNTSQILARVYGKGKEYQNIIDKFLTKSIRQDVHFTAYGFFVIDNTTLFKISSALVTYLVILIQFKQLEKSKD